MTSSVINVVLEVGKEKNSYSDKTSLTSPVGGGKAGRKMSRHKALGLVKKELHICLSDL